MTIESLIKYVQDFYTWAQGLDTSPGYLLGLAALFAIAGLLALREAAGWFFKIDDIKRDIARVQDTTMQLEAELRKFQALLVEANQKGVSVVEAQPTSSTEAGPTKLAEATSERPAASFPIHH